MRGNLPRGPSEPQARDLLFLFRVAAVGTIAYSLLASRLCVHSLAAHLEAPAPR